MTGEGKSIILGILATLLGCIGCYVDVVCYSEYLSNRDFNDFKQLFIDLGLVSSDKNKVGGQLSDNKD